MRREGLNKYCPSLRMFGFWFSERRMEEVGFRIDADFFWFIERGQSENPLGFY